MKKRAFLILIIMLSFLMINTKVYASNLNDIRVKNKIQINILDDKKIKKKEPKLDVKTGKKSVIKCKDVKFLHRFWVALEIIAPILVILFGSIDFVLSIISSDEKKIIKAREKFPKRLVAAFGIFMAFTIVTIIVSMSKNNSASETSLIECIVNGK